MLWRLRQDCWVRWANRLPDVVMAIHTGANMDIHTGASRELITI